MTDIDDLKWSDITNVDDFIKQNKQLINRMRETISTRYTGITDEDVYRKVKELGTPQMGDVAVSLGVTRSTVKKRLARLVQQGLLTKTQEPHHYPRYKTA